MYADEKRKAVPSTLKSGDQVFMKQERENKLSTTFNPKPLTVLNRDIRIRSRCYVQEKYYTC